MRISDWSSDVCSSDLSPSAPARARRREPRRTLLGVSTEPIDVIREFCAAFGKGQPDLDRIVGFFTEDAVYHNIPVDPVVGPDAIRTTLESFSTGVESLEFQVPAIAAAGGTVPTERGAGFRSPGKGLQLPTGLASCRGREGQIVSISVGAR